MAPNTTTTPSRQIESRKREEERERANREEERRVSHHSMGWWREGRRGKGERKPRHRGRHKGPWRRRKGVGISWAETPQKG